MGYNNYNREFEVNEEKTAQYLENALDKVLSEEDVDVLTDLVKLFKKNIPLTRRKYVTAFLLKEALKHYHFNPSASNGRNNRNNRNENRNDSRSDNRNENRNDRNNRREKNESRELKADKTEKTSVEAAPAEEEKVRRPRVEIPESEATSIFISIGKNRRVYPRDLVGLLVAVAGIDRDRIGDIKVLANYSFVQLYTADSQTAIDKLNGYDYRGRKLAVSFSKQKGEGEADESTENDDMIIDSSVDSGYVAPVSAANMTEAEMSAEDAAALAAAEKAAADKEPFGNI